MIMIMDMIMFMIMTMVSYHHHEPPRVVRGSVVGGSMDMGCPDDVRQAATLSNKKSSALSPQPSALSLQPSALSPQSSALSPQSSAHSLLRTALSPLPYPYSYPLRSAQPLAPQPSTLCALLSLQPLAPSSLTPGGAAPTVGHRAE